MTSRTTDGYVHHALFFGSDAELVEVAVPFLREGLAAGDAVVLSCEDRRNRLLADALDGDPRIGFLRRSSVYLHAPVAVAAYRRMVERRLAAGATRVRLVGEVDFGQDPVAWSEWIRYESLVNVALAAYPFLSVCAYDTGALSEPILSAAHRTHPQLLTRAGRSRNHRYLHPARFLRRSQTAEPSPPATTAPAVVAEDVAHVTKLSDLRDKPRDGLARALVPDQRGSDFISAVNEVAANGILHGRPPIQVRVWASPSRLVATVTDQGDGFDDPLAGHLPSRGRDPRRAGMGLWLVRQLCHQVGMSRGPEGFTVWLVTTIPKPPVSELERGVRAQGHAEAWKARAAKARERAEDLLRRYEFLEARASALERRWSPQQAPKPAPRRDDPAGGSGGEPR